MKKLVKLLVAAGAIAGGIAGAMYLFDKKKSKDDYDDFDDDDFDDVFGDEEDDRDYVTLDLEDEEDVEEEQKEEGGQGRALRGIAQDAVHCEALPAAEAEEQDARPEAEQGDLGSPVLEEALLPAGLLGALSSSAGGHALRPPLQRRSASGFQQAA